VSNTLPFLSALLARLPRTDRPANPIHAAEADAFAAQVLTNIGAGYGHVTDPQAKLATAPYDLRLYRDLADNRAVMLAGSSLPCPIQIGTCDEVVTTMCHGHIVDAAVVSRCLDRIVCKFLCHHGTGAKRLWLDLGQNWAIAQGEEFTVGQTQIDRATELLKAGH
jgi:hypothetical protein